MTADAPDTAGAAPRAGARILTVAVTHGAVAGVLSALVLSVMQGLQHVVWTGDVGPWRTIATVLAGAVLIVVLRRGDGGDDDLDSMVASAGDPALWHLRRASRLAGLGIVTVGFGAALGPEAGLIAVVTELSAVVSRRIARTREETREIGEFGVAATLAGVYGSPPGGAAWQDDGLTARRLPHLVAGAAGFVGFVIVHRAFGGGPADIGVPGSDARGVDLFWAVVPALAGAAVAAVHVVVGPTAARLAARVPGGATGRTLLLSAAFALVAAAVPAVLFSGHEELGHVDGLADRSAWGALVVLALLKVLATTLCLQAGWLGGVIFPLLFAGASAGAATLAVVPQTGAGAAIAAGMTAAAVVGLGRPLAAFLVCAFVVGGGGAAPLVVATVVGALVARALPGVGAGAGHGGGDH